MGLKFDDLIDGVRQFMIEEIELDAKTDKLHLSAWLTQSGQGNWSDALRNAANSGNDDTLASEIRSSGMLVRQIQRRKPKGGYTWADLPFDAHQVLAESEFNRYFCRGLSRHAINIGMPRLQVYRAKTVAQPRAESQSKIGLLVDPQTILIDLRSSQGVEPALGIPPGPGSGISLRIPKN
jgi:hypothetical protein